MGVPRGRGGAAVAPAAVHGPEADRTVVHNPESAGPIVLVQLGEARGDGQLAPEAAAAHSIRGRQLLEFELDHQGEGMIPGGVGGSDAGDAEQRRPIGGVGGHLTIVVDQRSLFLIKQATDHVSVDHLGGGHDLVVREVVSLCLPVGVPIDHPGPGVDVGLFVDGRGRSHPDKLNRLDSGIGAGGRGQDRNTECGQHGLDQGLHLHGASWGRREERRTICGCRAFHYSRKWPAADFTLDHDRAGAGCSVC